MNIKDIHGKWITSPMGFCHYHGHPGGLTNKQAFHHKCIGKKCKYFERYDTNKQKYNNRKVKR